MDSTPCEKKWPSGRDRNRQGRSVIPNTTWFTVYEDILQAVRSKWAWAFRAQFSLEYANGLCSRC